MRASVQKKGTRFYVVLELGKDESGRRRQKWVGSWTSREAAEVAKPDVLALHGPFSQYADTWLERQAIRLRSTTLASYAHQLRRNILPYLGDQFPKDVTPDQLERLYLTLLGRGLSNRSVRYVRTIIKKMYADGIRRGHFDHNPVDRTEAPARSPREADTWEVRDLRKFLDYTKTDDLYPLWLLAAMTGLRRGELLGLRIADLWGTTVHVQRQVVPVQGGVEVTAPKSRRGTRTVSVDSATVTTLREYISTKPAGYVFSRPDGSPLRPDYVTRRFRQLCRKADVPLIRFHDLRHTHATLALESGVHPKVITERLGHYSEAFTMERYQHVSKPIEAEAAQVIATLISGESPRVDRPA